MTDAVIVSTARTPIGKAYRGALNGGMGGGLLEVMQSLSSSRP